MQLRWLKMLLKIPCFFQMLRLAQAGGIFTNPLQMRRALIQEAEMAESLKELLEEKEAFPDSPTHSETRQIIGE